MVLRLLPIWLFTNLGWAGDPGWEEGAEITYSGGQLLWPPASNIPFGKHAQYVVSIDSSQSSTTAEFYSHQFSGPENVDVTIELFVCPGDILGCTVTEQTLSKTFNVPAPPAVPLWSFLAYTEGESVEDPVLIEWGVSNGLASAPDIYQVSIDNSVVASELTAVSYSYNGFTTPGHEYVIKITSVRTDEFGQSSTSSDQAPYMLTVPPPSVPTWGLVTFSGVNPVRIQWEITNTDAEAEDAITVLISDGTNDYTCTINASSCDYAGFTLPGHTYDIEIAALRTDIYSQTASSSISSQYHTIKWPGNAAIIYSGALTLSWSSIVPHAGNDIQYWVTIGSNGQPGPIVNLNTLDVDIALFPDPGSNYLITVRAEEISGGAVLEALNSPQVTYTTIDWPDGENIVFSQLLKVEWPTVVAHTGNTIEYTWRVDGGVPVATPGVTATLGSELFPSSGTSYFITIDARECYNEVCFNPLISKTATFTPIDWPAESAVVLSGLLNVAWPSITAHNGNFIRYSRYLDSVLLGTSDGLTTSSVDSSEFLTPGQAYVYSVTAQECFESTCWPALVEKTATFTPIEWISGSQVTTNTADGSVTIEWPVLSSSIGNSVKYNLVTDNEYAATGVTSPATLSVETQFPEPGTVYTITVTAEECDTSSVCLSSSPLSVQYTRPACTSFPANSVYLSTNQIVVCAIAKMDVNNSESYSACFLRLYGQDFIDAWAATTCDYVYYGLAGTLTGIFGAESALLSECVANPISSVCLGGIDAVGFGSTFGTTFNDATNFVLNNQSADLCTAPEFITLKSWKNGSNVIMQTVFATCVPNANTAAACFADALLAFSANFSSVTCLVCLERLVMAAANYLKLYNASIVSLCAIEPFSIGCFALLESVFVDFQTCSGFKYPETFPLPGPTCGDTTGWWEDSQLYELIVGCLGTGANVITDCPALLSPEAGTWEDRVKTKLTGTPGCAQLFTDVLLELRSHSDVSIRCIDKYSQACLELSLASRTILGGENRELVTGEAIYRPPTIQGWVTMDRTVHPYQLLMNHGVDETQGIGFSDIYNALPSEFRTTWTINHSISLTLHRFAANIRSIRLLSGVPDIPELATNKCEIDDVSFFSNGCELEAGSIASMNDIIRITGGFALDTKRGNNCDGLTLLSFPYKAFISAATAELSSDNEKWALVTENDVFGDQIISDECKVCFTDFINNVEVDTLVPLTTCESDPFDSDCISSMDDHIRGAKNQLEVCSGRDDLLSLEPHLCDTTEWGSALMDEYKTHAGFTQCALDLADLTEITTCTSPISSIVPSCIDCFDIFVKEVYLTRPAECLLSYRSDECFAALNVAGAANHRFEFCSSYLLPHSLVDVCSSVEWEPLVTSNIMYELVVVILRLESSPSAAITRFNAKLVSYGILDLRCNLCFSDFINIMYTLSTDDHVLCSQQFYSQTCQTLVTTFLAEFKNCSGFTFGWPVASASSGTTSGTTKAPPPSPNSTKPIAGSTTTTTPQISDFDVTTFKSGASTSSKEYKKTGMFILHLFFVLLSS